MKYDTFDYRTWHFDSLAKEYDDELFMVGTFDYEIWKREQKALTRIISKCNPKGRLLDFACGTGRIISYLEDNFDESIGIDISQDMLDQAIVKVRNANLICGDVTRNPHLVEAKFDCITCFRFFLNAQHTLRHEALRFIRNKLKNRDSIFVFNIHGNKFSTRAIMVAFHKFLNVKNQKFTSLKKVKKIFRGAFTITTSISKTYHMSIKEVAQMVEPHDLEIIAYYNVGFLHEIFFRFMPKSTWNFVEDVCESIAFLKPFCLYPIFVCKRKA